MRVKHDLCNGPWESKQPRSGEAAIFIARLPLLLWADAQSTPDYACASTPCATDSMIALLNAGISSGLRLKMN